MAFYIHAGHAYKHKQCVPVSTAREGAAQNNEHVANRAEVLLLPTAVTANTQREGNAKQLRPSNRCKHKPKCAKRKETQAAKTRQTNKHALTDSRALSIKHCSRMASEPNVQPSMDKTEWRAHQKEKNERTNKDAGFVQSTRTPSRTQPTQCRIDMHACTHACVRAESNFTHPPSGEWRRRQMSTYKHTCHTLPYDRHTHTN